jgi:hypothetical protein
MLQAQLKLAYKRRVMFRENLELYSIERITLEHHTKQSLSVRNIPSPQNLSI